MCFVLIFKDFSSDTIIVSIDGLITAGAFINCQGTLTSGLIRDKGVGITHNAFRTSSHFRAIPAFGVIGQAYGLPYTCK